MAAQLREKDTDVSMLLISHNRSRLSLIRLAQF
jgi:hypothetical protein